MNCPAQRFITFIQTHQPVYLEALTFTHLEIARLIFFHYLNDILFVLLYLRTSLDVFGDCCVKG